MPRRFLVIRQIVSCVCLPLAGGVELCLHLLSTNSSGCQQKLNCGCCCGCILENFNVIVDVADFLPVVHDNEDAFTTAETAVVASVMFVKSICFGMKIGFFLISLRGLSIAFCNVLMTSSSSGDLLHLLLPRLLLCGRTLVLSACCNTFSARTDLSPLSPTRSFNTSLSTLIARIGFSGASFSIARIIRPQPCLLLALLFRGSWGSRPWLFFFMGTWVPSLDAFSCFTSIWHVFHQTFCSPWELARVSSSFLVNLPLTPWLTASLSAWFSSPAAIGSLFRAPSTRCRMLLLHCCEPLVLTPTAVFDELLLVTVLMTPRATSHPPWHRRHGFPASLPVSPPASLPSRPRP